MIESILFRDMSLVTALGLRHADVLVEDGKIKTIGWDLPQNAELIVEDSGLLLLPGCIDPHVHFRDPGLTHKEDLERHVEYFSCKYPNHEIIKDIG